ncbi:MAG: murein biosynthesis integral membrane protein MurJ [Aquificae bacterium]|nr:murein biosynthesis integral membrane protein MurJ [Aquificota bacterium]
MGKSHFLKNTLLFSVATLISRVLGYLRDATIAYLFGASPLTDAFFVAWRIPNTLRQLVAEGSFNAVFIPIYSQIQKENPKLAKEYVSSLFSYYTVVLSIITVVGVVFSDYIVSAIAPGLAEKGVLTEASTLLKMVFPYIVLVGWVSFFMALLNTRDRFFIPAVSPALLNLSFIVSGFFLSQYIGIYALGVGAVVGGFLQVVLQIPYVVKEGLLPSVSFKVLPYLKETIKKLAPGFASFGINQFAFIIDTVIASFLVGGAISYLYYANRIFQLPVGLFAVALGNALLVSFSQAFTDGNMERFKNDFNKGLRFAVVISLPAVAGMVVLGKDILSVLLERGAFSSKDTLMSYYSLVGYSVGLLGYALARPYKSAFFSKKDTLTPLYATVVGLVVGIVSAVLFGFILGWGVFGLAFASSLNGFAGLFYLMFVSDFYVDWKGFFKTFIKAVLGVIVMVGILIPLKLYIPVQWLVVAVGVLVGGFVYFASLILLKEETAKAVLQLISKKLAK